MKALKNLFYIILLLLVGWLLLPLTLFGFLCRTLVGAVIAGWTLAGNAFDMVERWIHSLARGEDDE